MEFSFYGDEPRHYRDALEIVETSEPDEVVAALHRIDSALADGYSVAGYVAYEAGYAIENIDARGLGRDTLVAIGIFRGPSASKEPSAGSATLGPLVAQIDAARYRRDLAAIAAALYEGDVYQVNYTVPFAFAYDGDAEVLCDELRRRARVPYAAFVRHRERAIVSLSPELFFSVDGGRMRTKPMKGTSSRLATDELTDSKNRAEHVMIVDLLRNDMHRICKNVAVSSLFEVETYPTFATVTSTIEGTLVRGGGIATIFGALFPCGSITGAPKRSAMRQIARHERALRSVAMGAIGYCDAPRKGQWSVAIRTAVLDESVRRGELRVGGGIVADSDPDAEWAEILLKRSVFDGLARRTGLIETMRIEPDGTIARYDAHVARLERSAFALGLPFDAEKVDMLLSSGRAASRARPMLLRLTLDTAGKIELAERPIDDVSADERIRIAPQRLHASDPTLRHKTTARALYDAAHAFARAAGCFDAILLNEDGNVADGSRASVFLDRGDGQVLTPPLADGALAGILRAELLACGRAHQATLSAADLTRGTLSLGNSARGLMSVRLVPS